MKGRPGKRAAGVVIGGLMIVVALAGTPAMADSSADREFDALVAAYEIWQAEQEPVVAGRRGDLQAAARWPDASAAAVRARREADRAFLARLERIPVDRLTGNNRISHAVLDYLLRSNVALAAFDPERVPFVNDSGFFTMPLGVASSTRPRTIEEARA